MGNSPLDPPQSRLQLSEIVVPPVWKNFESIGSSMKKTLFAAEKYFSLIEMDKATQDGGSLDRMPPPGKFWILTDCYVFKARLHVPSKSPLFVPFKNWLSVFLWCCLHITLERSSVAHTYGDVGGKCNVDGKCKRTLGEWNGFVRNDRSMENRESISWDVSDKRSFVVKLQRKLTNDERHILIKSKWVSAENA